MSNRLISESSPYLLQHAHNPVDWYPWGEEALARAREEHKPLLVSIGYSACHWCHVMERESFEDAGTADIMNRHFVNIKIDREERPDLDQVFMDAVTAMTGSGGWPLNVFLTPEGKPFFGGTYFPPVRAYNRGSWREVLHSIASTWNERPQEVEAQAENLVAHIQSSNLFGSIGKGAAIYTPESLATISSNLMKNADRQWGGFGQAPKFPQTFSIGFLLRQYYHYQKKDAPADLPFDPRELLSQALLSLDKMIDGGIYDQLQGGFARYSTDGMWLAPHFEKMLYDNALLVEVLSEAWQITRNDRYAKVIEQTMHFISSEWQDSDGGFFSAYDADSEGVEGKYYTWSKQEIDDILADKELSELFCAYYDVSEKGNWEHTNILWVRQPLRTFCEGRGLDMEAAKEQIQKASHTLLQVRKSRVKPLLDDKKLMGWNALMVTACCKAWQAFQNPEYLTMAERATQFIEDNLGDGNGGYHHNYKNGKAANPAFLDDLAWYTRSLCILQECTGKASYLEKARSITRSILLNFSDNESPFFFYTPASQTDILFRKKDIYDGATPSGNSIMAYNLAYLGTLLNQPSWAERAAAMVGQVDNAVVKYPTSFGIWANLVQWQVYGWNELAIVGNDAPLRAAELLNVFIPDKIFQMSTTEDEDYPLLAGKKPGKNETYLYLCRQFACRKPVEKLEELIEMLQ